MSPAFDPADRIPLEARHRTVMLDLVLVWGSLDGALGQLLSRVLGLSFAEGAARIGRMPSSQKLAQIAQQMAAVTGGEEAARMVKKHKKAYEAHSKPRNLIAHSHCAGAWSLDPDYVVFAVFEQTGPDELAVDRVPLQQMERAIRWGRAMTDLALKATDLP